MDGNKAALRFLCNVVEKLKQRSLKHHAQPKTNVPLPFKTLEGSVLRTFCETWNALGTQSCYGPGRESDICV